jgi:hypothetical protein
VHALLDFHRLIRKIQPIALSELLHWSKDSPCLLRTVRFISPRCSARSGDRSFTIRPETAKFSAKPQAEQAEILPAFSEF